LPATARMSRRSRSSTKFCVEPGFSDCPISLHSHRRYAQRFTGFLSGEPAEIAKFDDMALTSVDLAQSFQRAIKIDDVLMRFVGNQRHFFQVDLLLQPGTLGGMF